MFKIGEFSRLTRVSMKMLRHYDEIGLFKPEQVDRFTGYRYYSYDQLPRLNRLLVLKGLGFSLDEIRQMLDGDLASGELRGMLRLRRAQVQRQADEALETLRQIEIRLAQIEQEGQEHTMSQIDVLVKNVTPLTVVGAREVVPSPAQMRERCIALNNQAWGLIESAGLKTDGISFALYYSDATNGIDVEMAYAIDAPPAVPAAATQAQVHTLPAATVAYAVYDGSYDDFGVVGRLHGALHQWIEANGYQISGATREFYLHPPKNSPMGVMEIQIPVEKEKII